MEKIDDEFCTDDVNEYDSKETKSVGSQTLESGPLPKTPLKPDFDYYTLRYDDFDWTPAEVTVFLLVSYFLVQKLGVFCYFFDHNTDLKQKT